MIRLEGPLRDHLEDPASDERVARIEKTIGARRLGRGERPKRRGVPLWIPIAALASVALVLSVLALIEQREPARQPVAKKEMIEAPETAKDPLLGAKIEADPPSSLVWSGTDPEIMSFALDIGGRASFDIPPDTGRRWVIDAGLARIEVLGTKLSVVRAPDRVLIDVEHGRVRVSSPHLPEDRELTDGEHLEVRVPPVRTASPVRAPKVNAPDVDALWEEADAARAKGDHPQALEQLARIIREAPADQRAGLASFIRARILQDVLGRPKDAAEAIALALQLGLAEDLRESARARLFSAYEAANDQDAARRAAFEYLASYPEGQHAAGAKRLADVDPR